MKSKFMLSVALMALMMQAPQTTQAADGESFNRLEARLFGTMEDGTAVRSYVLRNRNGMEVHLMEFGATLTAIRIPDGKDGTLNVIAGEDKLAPYLKGLPSASVIGRFANRIANGTFEIDGQPYQVTRNAGPHHIHGGRKGFARVVWRSEPQAIQSDAASVRLTYTAADGEEGFPGNVTVSVTYSLNDRNEVGLHYEAVTDKATPINLTNHAYFNLASEGGFERHELWIEADQYTVADQQLIPTGEIRSVEHTALDFRTVHPIGERADDTQPRPHLYDHNYIINGGGKDLVLTARVKEPVSGRVMEMSTTQPGVQLYTGNPIGFCLETQHYPDSVHQPHFPSTILRPGERFESTTVYAFRF